MGSGKPKETFTGRDGGMAGKRDTGLLRFSLFGLTEVHYHDSTSGIPVRRRLEFTGRQRAVLTVLLIMALRGKPIPVAEMARLLGKKEQTIYTAISLLNTEFDKAGFSKIVKRVSGGHEIDVKVDHIDVKQFEDLVTHTRDLASQEEPEITLKHVNEALSLFGDDEPMASVDCPEITEPRAGNLKAKRLAMRELWCDLNLRLNQPNEAVPVLEDLTGQEGLNESLHKKLMVALYRSGRQAEALKVFREFREQSVKEEGLEPGASMKQLHQRILKDDQTLLDPDAGF